MIDVDDLEVRQLVDELRAGVVDDEIASAAAAAIPGAAAATHTRIRTAAARHRRTGRLERELELEVHGSGLATSAEIHAGGVAAIIVGGSRPHTIRPVAGALRLAGGSVTGFAAVVHHPGTSPDPYFARGADAAEGERASIVDAEAARLADRVAARLEGG